MKAERHLSLRGERILFILRHCGQKSGLKGHIFIQENIPFYSMFSPTLGWEGYPDTR